MATGKSRVLLIGWDAADWKVIQPLLKSGEMPHLARLISQGVHGNIATIYPVLSPMLWTSIATGKRPYKHGIHGFSEPLPDGAGVRPITLLSRKTKAVWNILNQTGHRSVIVGWWPSHPAEPLNGVMVSNHFPLHTGHPGDPPPLPAGAVYPLSLASTLGELRVNPTELSGEFLRLFVPEYDKVDQDKDKRLHALAKIIAETMSVHGAATELLATQPWDFAAIYYSGIDHFGHAFMGFHPPRLPGVREEDFAIYQHVIANAYRYHDAMLGTLLEFGDANTTVILMSDHGFHPDHLRPRYIPAEPAGPAVEHRHFGILCLKGPALRVNEQVFGAGLLDLCPTILTLFGLPPGRDMDGKVLVTAFKHPRVVEPIESWDLVPGEAGIHPPETQLDPIASAEAFKQLVELGYVAPPGPNAAESVAECVRELKYNLARAYRDGNCGSEALAIAEELWTRWPREHRFGLLLIECLAALFQVARRRAAIDELARRIELYETEAKTELARRAEAKAREPVSSPSPADPLQRRRQYEDRQLREQAHGRPLLIEWLRVSQALLEQRPDEARTWLKTLGEQEGASDSLDQQVAGALAQLGDLETARSLLDRALETDPENAIVQAQLASVHFKSRDFDRAIAAATESLSLLYFQPALHALLGGALIEIGRFADAEKELLVAVAQSPRNLAAHEALGRLYRDHLGRPVEAFAHEGRARSLRNELAAQKRSGGAAPDVDLGGLAGRDAVAPGVEGFEARNPIRGQSLAAGEGERTAATACAVAQPDLPEPFGDEVEPAQVITVVSGLPRSGTSMMMQLLAAAGRIPLADARRAADEDNPLGYFEFARALELAKDVSWIPEARGKVVKIVAQLLPFLPPAEHYHVVFMERDLAEVIASQGAMLARQGRRGAELDGDRLLTTYAAQLNRVRQQLAGRADIRLLTVRYAELLKDPAAGVDRVARFLSEPFDRVAAAQAVHPELRRQRGEVRGVK